MTKALVADPAFVNVNCLLLLDASVNAMFPYVSLALIALPA